MLDTFTRLEGLKRWLVWRQEERNGRPAKIPYSPRTGGRASATDPLTWVTYDEAEGFLREFLEDGEIGGLGLVLGDLGDGLVIGGIDLTKKVLTPWAVPIVSLLRTYSEISPGGMGLKLYFCVSHEYVRWFLDLIRVDKGAWGTRRSVSGHTDEAHGPAIECYFNARYFCVTHRLWSGNHQRIERLDRARLAELAALIPPGSPTGSSSSSSYNGQGPTGDNSRSARAFRAALCATRRCSDLHRNVRSSACTPRRGCARVGQAGR